VSGFTGSSYVGRKRGQKGHVEKETVWEEEGMHDKGKLIYLKEGKKGAFSKLRRKGPFWKREKGGRGDVGRK